MTPWSDTIDTILLDRRVIRDVKLYARSGYMAVADDPFVLIPDLPDFKIRFDRESLCGTLEVPIANVDFDFSKEFEIDNPLQGFSEILLECTITHDDLPGGEESQYIFRGILIDSTPSNFDFGIVCVDKMHRCENSTCDINTEASIAATLDKVSHPPDGPTLTAIPTEYDAFTFAVDFGAPGQQVAYGQNHNPPTVVERRAWVLRSTRVLLDGVELPPDTYEVIHYLGLVKFYDTPAVGSHTVDSISFYQEGTNNVEDIIEEALRTPGPNIYVPGVTDPGPGPGFTDDELTETLAGTITITNGSKIVDGVGTAFSTDFSPGKRIKPIINSAWGVVASIDLGFPTTRLNLVYEYTGTTQVGVAYHRSSLDHAYASISQFSWPEDTGRVSDLIRTLREDHTRRDYFVFYDPMDDLIRGKLATIISEPDPVDHTLVNVEKLTTPRKIQNLYTRVLTIGTYERPLNLMSNATITLQQTLGVPPFNIVERTGVWNGYTFIDSAVTDPAFDMLHDGNFYNCHALESTTWGETDFRDYLVIDLGAIFDLKTLQFYPMGARNSKKFPMGLSLFSSMDGVGYADMDPSAIGVELKPGPDPYILEDPARGLARYIKIAMRPCKWVIDDQERTFGLAEIRIFGSEKVVIEAKIQDTVVSNPLPTPGVGGRYVGGVWIPTYYPGAMRKMLPLGYKTFFDEDAPVWDEISAADRAFVILREKINMYLQNDWSCPFDPRHLILDTVELSDSFQSAPLDVQRILIESLEIGFFETLISGTNYSENIFSGESA